MLLRHPGFAMKMRSLASRHTDFLTQFNAELEMDRISKTYSVWIKE